MSLVRDRFWRDPADLDPERRARRLLVLEAMLKEVACGADGRITATLIRTFLRTGDGIAASRAGDETKNIAASMLPGEWHVLSESWQGPSRDHYFAKALYVAGPGVDPEPLAAGPDQGTACLVSADLCEERHRKLADAARRHSEDLEDLIENNVDVESIWLSLPELRALGRLS